MNVITSNCIGGELYERVLKQQFNNPFMWCLLFADDYIYLYNHFDEIDFSDVELIRMTEKDDIGTAKHQIHKKIFGIRIDGKITVWYTHTFYDASCKEPTKKEISNIYYYKNYELVYNNYMKRLERMKEVPVFTIIAYQFQCWNKEKIEKLNGKYPIYIITDIQGCKSTSTKHIEYVRSFNKFPWADFENKIKSWKNFLIHNSKT